MTEIQIKICSRCGQRHIGEEPCPICALFDAMTARIDNIFHSMVVLWITQALVIVAIIARGV